jgi:hypothetical protein
MNRILTVIISALRLAGCADTYNKSVMPKAAANLQRETVGCKARWTAKEFRTYSECKLANDGRTGFATTVNLTRIGCV